MSRPTSLILSVIATVLAILGIYLTCSGSSNGLPTGAARANMIAEGADAISNTTANTEVDVTSNQLTTPGGILWITRHYSDSSRRQQINTPTLQIIGTPTRSMICAAADTVKQYGSDHPVADAQDIQTQCNQFNADAAASYWLSCMSDLNGLLDVIDADAPYSHQPLVHDLTNGQGMTLCNNTEGLPQEIALGYADQALRPFNPNNPYNS